jgi:hypothetical protein
LTEQEIGLDLQLILKVLKVLKVLKEIQVMLVIQEIQVLKVLIVMYQVLPDQQVQPGLKDHKVIVVIKVLRVI